MTVSELIAELRRQPQEMPVLADVSRQLAEVDTVRVDEALNRRCTCSHEPDSHTRYLGDPDAPHVDATAPHGGCVECGCVAYQQQAQKVVILG